MKNTGETYTCIFYGALVISMAAASVSLSEVRTGFWQLTEPTSDSSATRIDFSKLGPDLTASGVSSVTAQESVDCYFEYGKVYAPSGVFYDSTLNDSLKKLITTSTFPTNTESRFYLDSMMKKIQVEAPVEGYVDSFPGREGAYFIRTAENRYALLLKIREYIGGLDHLWYYWAYQPDESRVLYPENLYEQPQQLRIGLTIFSGRMDPYFTITDSATIRSLTRLAYISVNPFLDPSLALSDTPSCGNLSPRHISLYGMFPIQPPYSEFYPTIELCEGGIVNEKSLMPNREYLRDPDSRFEKAIIAAGCSLQLSYTDNYGTIDFCELFPDSLKTPVEYRRTTSGRLSALRGTLSITGEAVHYRTEQTGTFSIDLYSINGVHIATLAQGRHTAGQTGTVKVSQLRNASGVRILRLHSRGSRTETITIPVTITR